MHEATPLAANRCQDRFSKCRHENVVQGPAESPEGDGSAHQPHIPLPAKPLARPSLAVREREPANRGSHRRLRRVHEPGAGRRRGVLSEDEGQEAARTDHAEGRQHHADTEHESRDQLIAEVLTSTNLNLKPHADLFFIWSNKKIRITQEVLSDVLC